MKIKCSTEFLQIFLDGEMEPVEIEAVRRHLGCCPFCRQELSRLRLLWLELQGCQGDGVIDNLSDILIKVSLNRM